MADQATVYRFKFYDVTNDEWQRSRRWGTAEAIAATKTGVIEPETAAVIDARHLVYDGMTERNFDPHSGGP